MKAGRLLFGALALMVLAVLVLIMRPFAVMLRGVDEYDGPREDDS